MDDQEPDSDDLESPNPWVVRAVLGAIMVFLILTVALSSFVVHLAQDIEHYNEVNSRPVFEGVMDDTPITEARAQTIDLLLEIYQALEDQAGLGPWEPVTDEYQIQGADLICSQSGEGANEEYLLATAPSATTIEHATAIVEQVAAPHGFTRREDNRNVFIRHSDGARIWFGGGKRGYTIVNITTGCHPGTIYQDWPTGTENIPIHLRGIGRRHQDHETWSPQEPTNPTPSPPPGWTTPTPTPSTRPEPPSLHNTTPEEEQSAG